ncbi:hypothetical protein HDU92_005876 [Lobulomyces angularis]|nr:hypothetical protein HDU92_005876 [Lobulomyces angularis]
MINDVTTADVQNKKKRIFDSIDNEDNSQFNTTNSLKADVSSNDLLESSLRRMKHRSIEGNKQYKLVMRQEPVHVRMCGGSDKDRRTIDPPPIVEVLEVDEAGQLYPIIKDSGFFIMRVELWNEAKTERAKIRKRINKDLPLILGDLVMGSRVLLDDLGRTGTFFVFDDISVRYQGRFSLKFKFYDLESEDENDCLVSKATIKTDIFSENFVAITAREFPGMLKSSQITKVFKTQGLKLSVRN